jgi:hypothetical protein
MPNEISRQFLDGTNFTATNSASTSPRQAFGTMAGAIVFVISAASATSITWYVCYGGDDTPVPLTNSAGNAVTTAIAAGNAYELPSALYAARYIVPVTNAGTAVLRLCSKA